MRISLIFLILGIAACGGNVFDCEEGTHRSGEGCVPDRVFGEVDTGGGEDTGF